MVFLHWPVEPVAVRPLMPPGVVPDVIDGRTYVGLIAFLMDRVGVLGGPGMPYFGRFPETNVRLYSVDRHGRPGIVFRSMDAARLVPVWVGRSALRLPYTWSRMTVARRGDEVTYVCRRRHGSPAKASRIRVRVGEAIERPTALERFLTDRWASHSAWGGRTLYLPTTHPPWPLRRATLRELDDSLVATAGLDPPAGPPVSVLYSPGVPARFGWPTVV